MDRLREAYRYCQWIAYHHYENFPVASWLLPKKMRPYVAAIYAFARSADDFADEAKYQGHSLELLDRWRKALWACSDGGITHPIFLALADTIKRFRLPVELCDDLLTAFTLDVTKRRYNNWQELMNYCRHSANPVGRLVLAIFGYRDPELYRLSDFICTGLQLANHWQDLSIDLKKDLLYIPLDLLTEYGLGVEELKEGLAGADPADVSEDGDSFHRFRSLMGHLVQRARELFDQGEPIVFKVSGRLRRELRLTVLGGRAILARIEKLNYDVLRHRPVLSGWEKVRLLTHALVA